MSQYPESWSVAPLAEIASIEMGQSPNSQFYNDHGEGLPFFQGKAEFGSMHPTTRKWCSSPKKVANQGDILLSLRAPVGPTNLAAEKCCIGRGLAAVHAREPFSQSYLLRLFRNLQPWLSEQGTGTTFAAISGELLRTIEVPVPPHNEQERIADKLDAVLARVDACRDRLDRIPVILKRFRQSVLAAATSGKMTEGWRNERYSGSGNWTEIPLDHACTKITDGEHISPALITSGVPLVSAKDVRDWGVDFSDTKFVGSEFASVSRRRCNPELDDVLVVSRGATVGRACLIASRREFCLMGSVLLFKPDLDRVIPRYLAAFLRSPLGLERLTGASGASAQSAIYIRDTKRLLISLPPKNEQTEIVRRVESLFAFADRLEARYAAARTQVENLTPATLAKAFRGELVPQDPNDEPASVLLERIRAKRGDAAADNSKRGPQSPQSKNHEETPC